VPMLEPVERRRWSVLGLNGGGRKSSILLVRPLGFEPKTLCLEGDESR